MKSALVELIDIIESGESTFIYIGTIKKTTLFLAPNAVSWSVDLPEIINCSDYTQLHNN